MTDELKQWEYDRGYDKGKADMLKVIGNIKQEIEQTVNEEADCDEKWAVGLRYAIKIIDKHTKGE